MKKANLLKKTAFPRVPSISDGFVPLDGFGFKFVVSLSGVDIKIHGFNGSSWELLHETDGLTESYITEVTHQKYFFESKNGEEQTIRVSFLSSEKEENLGLRAGVSKETRKFHDIEEVPVYRAGMQGKMLTIMSDGSLAWLLANESFVIGGNPQPPLANLVGLEENPGLTLHGNAQLIDGVLELDGSAGTYASLPHSTDYERESGDMTVNFWFNADSMPAETGATFVSKSTGSHAWDGWIIYYSTQGSGVGGTGPAMTNGGVGLYIDQTGSGQPTHSYRAAPAGGLPTGAWHHVAVTMPATGDYSLFVNGESILSWSPASRNTSTNSSLMFGANAIHQDIGNFFSGKIDGVVIQKQILTAQEISDLHAAGRGASQPQPEEPAPSVPEVVEPEATLEGWETPFVLGGSGQFQNLEGVGTRLKTLSNGYAYARWDDFLTSKYSSWTTSVWFRTTDLSMTGMNRKLFGQRNGDHGMVFKLIDNSGSGDIRLSYSFPKASSWSNYPTYAFNLTKDSWVNLVVTFDATATTTKVYLNGQLINTVGQTGGLTNLISDTAADLSSTVNSGFLPLASNSKTSDGGSSTHYFDFYGFQMVEDVVLTDSQVATVYNDGSNQNVVVSSDL